MYLAEKDHVLVSVDYSQEELITLAATLKHMFGKSRMADAVNAGLDLHALFAANRDGMLADLDLNRMTEPDVAAVIKSRIAAYKDDKKLKPRRQLAKMANFLTGVTLLKGRCENVENCWNSLKHQIATV